jgi:hypothetical protein
MRKKTVATTAGVRAAFTKMISRDNLDAHFNPRSPMERLMRRKFTRSVRAARDKFERQLQNGEKKN